MTSQGRSVSKRTLLLKASLSSGVKASDFAMTGTTLTTSDNFFITIMSMGRREWPMKGQSNLGHQKPNEHTRGVDEEEAAVDTGVGNIAVTHGRQLLSEVGRMLVLSGKGHSQDSQRTQK
jgi:hypothetical protein